MSAKPDIQVPLYGQVSASAFAGTSVDTEFNRVSQCCSVTANPWSWSQDPGTALSLPLLKRRLGNMFEYEELKG